MLPSRAAAAALVLLCWSSAQAIARCKAKTLTDGTIVLSAREIVGTPHWGVRYGTESAAVDNAGTCITGDRARGCTLAAVGIPGRTELPASCTIYLADDGAETCSAWVKRCLASSEPLPCAVLPAVYWYVLSYCVA